MGICYSCLRGQPQDDYDQPTERTPLIQEYAANSMNSNPLRSDSDHDKIKRQEALNSIVGFTGENLIDVTSVAQPEVNTIGRSASEYRRLLVQLASSANTSPMSEGAGSTQSDPALSNALTKSLGRASSTKKIDLPRMPESKSLTEQERSWLRALASKANDAVNSQPQVQLPGTLVHTFA